MDIKAGLPIFEERRVVSKIAVEVATYLNAHEQEWFRKSVELGIPEKYSHRAMALGCIGAAVSLFYCHEPEKFARKDLIAICKEVYDNVVKDLALQEKVKRKHLG